MRPIGWYSLSSSRYVSGVMPIWYDSRSKSGVSISPQQMALTRIPRAA